MRLQETIGQASLERMAQEALLIRLYADKHVSTHQVIGMLGTTHDEFARILARYGVAKHDTATELALEIRHQNELLQPKTPLVQKLAETRARIIISGERLLEWDDVEREVAERRGGVDTKDVWG